MICLKTAQKLKEIGVLWQPANGDQFAIPDRGMDEQRFLINDMPALVEMIQGHRAVTFHGTPEWALDYLWLGETVWLPHEGQLRALLQDALEQAGSAVYDLLYADGQYVCRFEWQGEALAFSATDAAEAYALALLHVMSAEQ